MDQSPLIYTPEAPKAIPAPKVEYVLKRDVAGLPPPSRGPQTIDVIVPDKNGGRMKVKAQVPNLPNPKCKNCYGKGYVGFETKSQKVIFCHKCFDKK